MQKQHGPHNWTIEDDLTPLKSEILVTDMEYGEQLTETGLIITNDDGKDHGIRPRWCTVYKKGSDVDYVEEGQRMLIAHGRWTLGVKILSNTSQEKVVRRIDTNEILLIEDKQ